MRGKPYLEIEIDEHSSDVGAITRLEAFLDSLKNVTVEPAPVRLSPFRYRVTGNLKRKIYLPPMTDQAQAIVAAFQACGGEAEALPPSDEETLELGRQLTSGKECYPSHPHHRRPGQTVAAAGFRPGEERLLHAPADGPCRFGQYHRFHRMVLDDLGYPQMPVYSPDQNENMYRELGLVGGDFSRIAWNGFVAIDLLEKKLRETRPYESTIGESDKIYEHYLQKVVQALRDRGDLPGVLKESRREFDAVSLSLNGGKPIVGVVGEIYTRANEFSNENAVREIEALGGEVWMPPIGEWLLYVTHSSKATALVNRRFRDLLTVCLEERVQIKDEHRLSEISAAASRTWKNPLSPKPWRWPRTTCTPLSKGRPS